jgi:hypothetical protein
MNNSNTLQRLARQLYIDDLLNLRTLKMLLKQHTPLNDADREYFELLGHVIETVNAAKTTHAKSRREELKKAKEKALFESLNT